MNTRKVYEIASDIIMDMEAIAKEKGKYWRKMFPYCHQQLDAMMSLSTPDDNYMFDSGRMVIGSALANMSQYKGENAKKYKNELRAMLGPKLAK